MYRVIKQYNSRITYDRAQYACAFNSVRLFTCLLVMQVPSIYLLSILCIDSIAEVTYVNENLNIKDKDKNFIYCRITHN